MVTIVNSSFTAAAAAAAAAAASCAQMIDTFVILCDSFALILPPQKKDPGDGTFTITGSLDRYLISVCSQCPNVFICVCQEHCMPLL